MYVKAENLAEATSLFIYDGNGEPIEEITRFEVEEVK
jgi:hypothetical protein